MNYKIEDIELSETCGACPEQYDAYIGSKQVGYLRLRHGYFRVDFPDCGGETIYDAHPKGDGIFDSDEREFYLTEAKKAIIKKLTGEHPDDGLWCEVLKEAEALNYNFAEDEVIIGKLKRMFTISKK